MVERKRAGFASAGVAVLVEAMTPRVCLVLSEQPENEDDCAHDEENRAEAA
jgi:hypothetical protein